MALDVEGVVPGVDIGERREGADEPRRMRAVDDLPRCVITPFDPPDLRVPEEHPLRALEAIEHWGRRALERQPVRVDANQHAVEVGDVLTVARTPLPSHWAAVVDHHRRRPPGARGWVNWGGLHVAYELRANAVWRHGRVLLT